LLRKEPSTSFFGKLFKKSAWCGALDLDAFFFPAALLAIGNQLVPYVAGVEAQPCVCDPIVFLSDVSFSYHSHHDFCRTTGRTERWGELRNGNFTIYQSRANQKEMAQIKMASTRILDFWRVLVRCRR
jgi:hypothetical protein